MRHFVLTGLLLALLLVPAGAARPATRVEAGSGISVVLPTGWRFIHRPLSDRSDPVQRLAVASRGATALGVLALLRLPEDPADHAERHERAEHHGDDERIERCRSLVEQEHQSSSRRRRLTWLRRRFCSSRRSTAARLGFVGRRRRGTFRASRSASTSRSVASSRLRHWLRSSWATARMIGPARASTRRFCASESADEASTSKLASTRVSLFCACCPPGPLEREKRSSISARGMVTERVT